MQAAARKVAWENKLLRDLLASRGVTSKEISSFILQREQASLESKACGPTQTRTRRATDQEIQAEVVQTFMPAEASSFSTAATIATEKLMVPSPPSHLHDTMSCENAANIIAGMRGTREDALVKMQLGCHGAEECNVKNVKVFQVMEMD
jgi:hypothetical protein